MSYTTRKKRGLPPEPELSPEQKQEKVKVYNMIYYYRFTKAKRLALRLAKSS